MKTSDKRFLLALEAGTDFVLEYAAGGKRKLDQAAFRRALSKHSRQLDGASWNRHDRIWTLWFLLSCPVFAMRFSSFGPDEAFAVSEAGDLDSFLGATLPGEGISSASGRV